MFAYLITGNPGSGKSTLAMELRRRGLIALDTDEMAFWANDAGIPVDQPAHPDDQWRLAHRWVWSRARIEQSIAQAAGDTDSMFFCGIALNQTEVLVLFEQVFLLAIDEDTQLARLALAVSPDRTNAIKKQIRDGRLVFQSQMLAHGAIPLDATAPPHLIVGALLSHLGLRADWSTRLDENRSVGLATQARPAACCPAVSLRQPAASPGANGAGRIDLHTEGDVGSGMRPAICKSPCATWSKEPGGEPAESWQLRVTPGSYPDVYKVMNVSGGSTNCRARQFTDLFGSYYGPVLAYVRRRVGADVAQDVVAETFLAAWRNLDDLPPRPLPWLYRTANFAVANQRRTLARRAKLDDRARLLAGSTIAHDHSELIAADMELAAAFRSLSEADREVLRLAAWEGLSVTAIGIVLGCSAVAVKARLYRARQRLSRKLGAVLPEPHQQPAQPTALKEAQP
jgi:RNA polymerase sigma-70 factor (ECF subfamily)